MISLRRLVLSLAIAGAPVARAGCEFEPGSPLAPFRAEAKSGARVALEIRLEDGSRDPSPLLDALTEHEVPATLLVEPTVATRWSSVLSAATKHGHDVGVLVHSQRDLGVAPETILQVSVTRWWQELKQARRMVKRAAGQHPTIFAVDLLDARRDRGVRADAGAHGRGRSTAGATRLGDSTLPRSRPGSTKLLGQGGYTDMCGSTLASWTPAAFNRVADATRAGWPVRVELPTAGFDGELLGRWLDAVGPEVRFVTGKELAGLSLQELGAGTGSAATTALRAPHRRHRLAVRRPRNRGSMGAPPHGTGRARSDGGLPCLRAPPRRRVAAGIARARTARRLRSRSRSRPCEERWRSIRRAFARPSKDSPLRRCRWSRRSSAWATSRSPPQSSSA